MATFQQLLEKTKTIAYFQGISHLISWDQETYMPSAAAEARSEQLALLAGHIHALKTDPELEKIVWELAEKDVLQSADEKTIVEKLKRDITKSKALPTKFVERFAKKTSEAMFAWQNAKSKNSWSLFAPHLQEVYMLAKEKAAYLLDAQVATSAYQALMDEFEPNVDLQFVDNFFSELKQQLCPLFKEIISAQHRFFQSQPKADLTASHAAKKHAAVEIITRIGYDWTKSRLDDSSHPFSMAMHPTDSRITIRSNETTGTMSQLMSALHEAGHSLYEMGLPLEHYGTPLCEAASLSVHESQSRLWETIIGRSPDFMPIMQAVIQDSFQKHGVRCPEADLKNLYDSILWVEPSYIRTEADEVSYPLHVILRYEIEKELFSEKLTVDQIPDRWNEGMKELLGIVPKSQAEGCLQDIHWSMGAFGYFPTYTLGSWYAICLMNGMKKAMPHLQQEMAEGNFFSIHQWLKNNIWSQGRRYDSRELVTKALGRPPMISEYVDYLKEKYLARILPGSS